MSTTDRRVEVDQETVDRLATEAAEGRPVILTRDGEPVAAVVGIATLKSMTDERELLRRLALGELESAAGEGHALEDVLEECRMLLEEN
jgi:prevent-host-death family protein